MQWDKCLPDKCGVLSSVPGTKTKHKIPQNRYVSKAELDLDNKNDDKEREEGDRNLYQY